MIKFLLFIEIALLLLTIGCAATSEDIADDDHTLLITPLEETFTIPPDLTPREQAAMELTRQGWAYLKQERTDEAIRVLEKALNLNPTGGQTYYYLSEAWLMNGNADQALNFNRLAELYSHQAPDWQQRIGWQRERITELNQ